VTAPVRIHIESTSAHLPVVRGAVEQMCRLIGFDNEAACRAVSAVDEALANIIEHAYEGREGQPIEIRLAALPANERGGGLEVVLIDRGCGVGAEGIHGRDLSEIRPGGLGTHIMDCCMDEIRYSHPPAGGTELRMRKYAQVGPPTEEEGHARDR